MFCPHCGTRNEETATTCVNCGQSLAGVAAAVAAAQTPAYGQPTPPMPPVAPPPTSPPGVTQAAAGAYGGRTPPKQGISALLAGGIGFAVIALVGGLVYFLALKPTNGPGTIPGPSIPGPSIPGPSIPGPSIPGPSIPPRDGGQILVSVRFCSDATGGTCQNPGNTQPATNPQFATRVAVTSSSAGDTVGIDFFDPSTGQEIVDQPFSFTLTGQPNCQMADGTPAECIFGTIGGGPFKPQTIEVDVTFNGQTVDFGGPLILTLQ